MKNLECRMYLKPQIAITLSREYRQQICQTFNPI